MSLKDAMEYHMMSKSHKESLNHRYKRFNKVGMVVHILPNILS